MGFYAVNNSWAAPLILSAVDEKSLDFRDKLVTSQQTIEDLKVDTRKLQSGIAEMKKHRAALLALEPQLQEAIAVERTHNRATGPQLAALDTQKQADNVKTQAVLVQLDQVESNINKDLAAGLITKGDAATQLSALNQAESAYTDSKIAEVQLTDSILQKTTTGTDSLDVLEKQAELRSEAAQLDVATNVAEKGINSGRVAADRPFAASHPHRQTKPVLPERCWGARRCTLPSSLTDDRASAVAGRPIYDCLPQYDCVPQGRHSEPDIRGGRDSDSPNLQDQHARFPDANESRPPGFREIQDLVPRPQAAFLLRRTLCFAINGK